MNSSTRIAITGSGAVCGAGMTVGKIWDAVLNGRSAVAPITQWNSEHWPVQVAASVTGVRNQELVEDRKLHKSISRTDLFGIYAAGEAVKSSRILEHRQTLDAAAVPHFNDRTGIVVGSGGGAYNCNYDYFPLMTTAGGDMRKFGEELGSTVNPMWLLKNLPNNVLCHVGIRHTFKGTNACITNQCTGGVLAVAEAASSLRANEADRIVAIGHDTPIEPETVLGYERLGLLSHDILRPFDRDRSGTIFGEGAASMMLEKFPDAVARKAPMMGEFLGYGCVTEATGVVDVRPDGDGPARAMMLALADAGISAAEIGMVVAHGNGTRASDASEAQAILRVFGGKPPPVTGFKWAVGHLIAASGILDLVIALEALREGVVPGVPTLNAVDPEFATLPASRELQKLRGNTAMVICRGFAGMNVVLVVRSAKVVMSPAPPPSTRCGIDTVEVARVEKILRETPPSELRRFFSEQELADSGDGPGRAASLAARFAAKEACCKLFPRETALGTIEPTDFSVRRDGYGAPQIEASAAARAVMDRCMVGEIRVSLTHTATTASSVAVAETKCVDVPWFGKFVYHCLPLRRRVVVENLRRVFGAVLPEDGIQRLAQSYYAHFIRFLGEFIRLPWMSAKRKKAMIRVENMEVAVRAHAQGRGMLLLAGHFGNWEVATVAGIGAFSQFKGMFHFVRKPLKPALLNHYVTWRFRRSGFGTIGRRGSLDTILDLLAKERIIVFVYDQHATGREGVVVDFLGHPASTFKSLAIIAMNTGAPVIPASSWREPDGTHVFRFEEPVPIVEHENTSEAIRLNTRAFNAALERMLLRHPEQWIWMHQRWKADPEWARRQQGGA